MEQRLNLEGEPDVINIGAFAHINQSVVSGSGANPGQAIRIPCSARRNKAPSIHPPKWILRYRPPDLWRHSPCRHEIRDSAARFDSATMCRRTNGSARCTTGPSRAGEAGCGNQTGGCIESGAVHQFAGHGICSREGHSGPALESPGNAGAGPFRVLRGNGPAAREAGFPASQ